MDDDPIWTFGTFWGFPPQLLYVSIDGDVMLDEGGFGTVHYCSKVGQWFNGAFVPYPR